jgi:hypothetical protein
VRLKTRTRGHAFVVMLAYGVIRALATLWRNLDSIYPTSSSQVGKRVNDAGEDPAQREVL